MVVFKRPLSPPTGQSARAMIFRDALPLLKTFLKPVSLSRCAQALLIR
jgi:hypothetical protein